MVFHRGLLSTLLFLLYINDIHTCSDTFNFYLFADDTYILHANKNLRSLEATVTLGIFEARSGHFFPTRSLVGFLKIKNGGGKFQQIWNDCPLCPAAGSRWADKCRNGKFPNKWGFPWVKNVVVFSFKKAFWRYSATTQARALGSISHADKYFKKMV